MITGRTGIFVKECYIPRKKGVRGHGKERELGLTLVKNLKTTVDLNNNVGTLSASYFRFAKQYFKVGQYIFEDMKLNYAKWKADGFFFFAGSCLRLAVELKMKGRLCELKESGVKGIDIDRVNHKLWYAYNQLNNKRAFSSISNEKKDWLCQYFTDIKAFDSKGDLFRYTFDEGALRDHADEMLIFDRVLGNLVRAYMLISDEDADICDENGNTIPPKYLVFNHDPYGSYIWQEDNFKLYSTGKRQSISTKYYTPLFEGFTGIKELVLEGIEEEKLRADKIYFPVLYMCRNDIELHLKHFLYVAESFPLPQIQGILHKGHDLSILLQDVKTVIDSFSNSILSDYGFQDVKALVSDFDLLEGSSEGNCYRYPVDKCENYYTFSAQRIDIQNAYKCVDRIEDFLINATQETEKYFAYLAQSSGYDKTAETEVLDETNASDITELQNLLDMDDWEQVELESRIYNNKKYDEV